MSYCVFFVCGIGFVLHKRVEKTQDPRRMRQGDFRSVLRSSTTKDEFSISNCRFGCFDPFDYFDIAQYRSAQDRFMIHFVRLFPVRLRSGQAASLCISLILYLV
jgi:hypothetical protein